MASTETVLAIVTLILTWCHLPFIDWEPQVDISWASKGSSGPRSRHHHPVAWFIWLGVSPTPPRKPPVVLRQSQHDGSSWVSNLGWGRDCGPGQAGFVNTGSLDRLSAPPDYPHLSLSERLCSHLPSWNNMVTAAQLPQPPNIFTSRSITQL